MAKQITERMLNDLRAYREEQDESQTEFWGRFGLTQSAGSRYEHGQRIPAPTAMLLALVADGHISIETLQKTFEEVTSHENVKVS